MLHTDVNYTERFVRGPWKLAPGCTNASVCVSMLCFLSSCLGAVMGLDGSKQGQGPSPDSTSWEGTRRIRASIPSSREQMAVRRGAQGQ